MPIPDYQKLMLPLLKFTSDKKEHSTSESLDYVWNYFNLTELEMSETLPSGGQTIIENRASWARTYLKKAGLLESPRRGYYKITDRGLDALKKSPDNLEEYLFQFSEFREFKSKRNAEHLDQQKIERELKAESGPLDPMETLETSFQKIKNELAEDLLKELKVTSPSFFEKAVLKLLQKMGYGNLVEHTGKAGDEGIDGKIREDKLGLDMIYVQAKRWKDGVIGRPEIHKFIGALSSQGASKGIFITTSTFSNDALECVSRGIPTKIVLIDGFTLAQYMIDYDVGVSKVKNFEIKRKDTDFFVEE
jgi:restriction system protein